MTHTRPPTPPSPAAEAALSALLDGELSKDQEEQLFSAMAQDASLLAAFEALAHARAAFAQASPATLSTTDAGALAAGVFLAIGAVDGVSDATALASLAVDGALDAAGDRAFAHALAEPGAAGAVVAFVHASELTQVGARAVADTVEHALAFLPERLDARFATEQRAEMLLMAQADGALDASEQVELAGLASHVDAFERGAALVRASASLREAFCAATDSPAFLRVAQRAGDAAAAAVVVIERNSARAAATAAIAPRTAQTATTQTPGARGFWQVITAALSTARVPLALSAAAGALFFALREPPTSVGTAPATDTSAELAGRELAFKAAYKAALFEELAPALPEPAPAARELALLADNSSDVEAIDGVSTTMVFATQASNITVIWVDSDTDDDGEQGT